MRNDKMHHSSKRTISASPYKLLTPNRLLRKMGGRVLPNANSKGNKPSILTPSRKRKLETTEMRPSPLPEVNFANSSEVWELMCNMDEKYRKPLDIFKNHPVLSPQMRAILFDWIMDVCEAYTLHRETLYLAIDYLDRYLSLQNDILKHHLQLIGITCLFIAAKMEEIYPPKLHTFAYVTDGACTESDILDMELVIMKTLKWNLNPITPPAWVNIYLQVLSVSSGQKTSDFLRTNRYVRELNPEDVRLTRPQYSPVDFVRALRIIDLAILDLDSSNFSYSTLAAAAIYHTKGRQAALASSGFQWECLSPCINWLAPFAAVLKKTEVPEVLPGVSGISDEARHLVQTHCITLSMLDSVQLIATSNKVFSPMNHTDAFLTPPRSTEKNKRGKH